jgi:hypothetical protein
MSENSDAIVVGMGPGGEVWPWPRAMPSRVQARGRGRPRTPRSRRAGGRTAGRPLINSPTRGSSRASSLGRAVHRGQRLLLLRTDARGARGRALGRRRGQPSPRAVQLDGVVLPGQRLSVSADLLPGEGVGVALVRVHHDLQVGQATRGPVNLIWPQGRCVGGGWLRWPHLVTRRGVDDGLRWPHLHGSRDVGEDREGPGGEVTSGTVRGDPRGSPARGPGHPRAGGPLRGAPEPAFVPQTHEPGAAAEVDFADLWIVLRGVKTKAFLFTLRLVSSPVTDTGEQPATDHRSDRSAGGMSAPSRTGTPVRGRS